MIAHELGHFRHRHVCSAWRRARVITFVGLAAFGWLCKQPWLLPAFGLDQDDDAVRLFVCLLLASVVSPICWRRCRTGSRAATSSRPTITRVAPSGLRR